MKNCIFVRPKAAEFAFLLSFMSLLSRGPNLKGQPKKQGSMLGKYPAMSDALVKGGSTDPKTSLGQGGVFVLSVQIL